MCLDDTGRTMAVQSHATKHAVYKFGAVCNHCVFTFATANARDICLSFCNASVPWEPFEFVPYSVFASIQSFRTFSGPMHTKCDCME